MEKLTAAHRTLPLGAWVRVTNLSNERRVDVRIIDRGPFVDGRIVDLSHAAAKVIDMIGPGTARVRLDVLSLPAMSSLQAQFAVQAGAFRERARAERLSVNLEREYGSARVLMRDGTPPMWRVVVGDEPDLAKANELADRIKAAVGNAFVVRLDEVPTP